VADEEITDLTEDAQATDAAAGKAKKKAPKAAKAPKEEQDTADAEDPKGKKGKKEKKAKPDKKDKVKGEKGGAGGVIIIMILVLVILIGGFAAALYFDVFDARIIVADVITDPILEVLIWLDPAYSSINQRLRSEAATQERRFEERSAQFEEREEDIALRETVLDTREQQLDRRALELDRREDQITAMYERTVPIHRRDDITEEELEDMISLSRTYTQMSPDDAANILVRLYDPRDVAAILYHMTERNAGSILAVMDPAYAANITEILLYN